MRGVKRCQESTGRMKKHRYSNEFKVTAVKLANALDIETKAVAEALHIHPFMLSRWKKEVREGKLTGSAHPKLKEVKAMEVTVAEEKRIRQQLKAGVNKSGRHDSGKAHMSVFKLIGGVVFNVAIFGGLLFLPAGTLDWWRAWVFLGVVFVGTVASTVSVFRVNKDLLEERFKPPIQKGQPLADKIVVVLLIAAFVSLIVFIPLGVFRFHLMATPGTLVSSLGLVLFVLGWWIMTLALKENAFAAPVVKHQKERQQTVIDSGVYGVVRHPMYAGAVPLLVGMPLWLESYAAAMLASFPIGTLAVRILVEEQFLRRELAGYDAYTERVRYRLIPFVW